MLPAQGPPQASGAPWGQTDTAHTPLADRPGVATQPARAPRRFLKCGLVVVSGKQFPSKAQNFKGSSTKYDEACPAWRVCSKSSFTMSALQDLPPVQATSVGRMCVGLG